MTHVEAKFGFKISDSKPSDTGFREPSEVGAVNSLSPVEGKGSSVPRVGCFKCDGSHFQRDCNASKNAGKQSSGKGNQGKSWSKSESSIKGRGKEKTMENPKGSPKEPKVRSTFPKAPAKEKH